MENASETACQESWRGENLTIVIIYGLLYAEVRDRDKNGATIVTYAHTPAQLE